MVEVEIKLAIGLAQAEAERLESLGASLVQPRGFEENVVFDLPGSPLRRRGALLRVRRTDARGALTFKEPVSGPEGFKVRREIEASLPDPALVTEALEAAGFRAVWRYCKYRTTYSLDDLAVFVDETPIGNYLELEGAPASIDELAARLGRSPRDYILGTYRSLQEDWCRARGRPAGDLVFESEQTP